MRSLIVHGGAWQIPDDEREAHLVGLEAALAQGIDLLERGAPALDAVVETIARLEDNPTFDAGRGSVLNSDGRIEMDASLMDGATLKIGACISVTDLTHPIRLARAICDDGRAVILSGEGASRFAREHGIPACTLEDLVVDRETRRKEFLDSLPDFQTRQPFDGTLPGDTGSQPLGTVGAVCCDAAGNLAAGTSTGGAPDTIPGRVGDSPIPGAGTWAENGVGAASSTGWGEAIVRELLAFRAVQEIDTVTICWKKPPIPQAPPHPIASDRISWGPVPPGTSGSPEARTARCAVRDFARRVGGVGGLILIGPDGTPAFAFNAPRMARGHWIEGMGVGKVEIEAF